MSSNRETFDPSSEISRDLDEMESLPSDFDMIDFDDDDDLDEEDIAAIEAARQEALDAAFKAKKKRRKKRRTEMLLSAAKELHKESVSDEVVVRFSHVTKTYRLYKNDRARILGLFKPNRGNPKTINANDDISFEIKKGEAVAFMGLNGAGKSTALKMVSGVTFPTSGEIEVNGRISALLELRAGFDNRLTGRENIRLRGMILGLSKEELDEIEPKVIEFAGIGGYIDQPMRLYSSGMKARVGFGLSVSLNPEVLVVDEALSVGDRKFRRKCIERIRDIMTDENVTVLFVTHSTSTAKAFCTRGIVLDHGKKVFDGPFEEATKFYTENIVS